MLFSIYKKISSYFICNCLIFKRAENGTRTRAPQLGKLFFTASIILYIKYLFYIQKQFAYNLHNKYPHEHLHNHFCGS